MLLLVSTCAVIEMMPGSASGIAEILRHYEFQIFLAAPYIEISE
jgi:hypothetical protein